MAQSAAGRRYSAACSFQVPLRKGWPLERRPTYSAQVASFDVLVAKKARRYVLALLSLITTNNYLDRIVLGILVQAMMKDLHFTEIECGYVVVNRQPQTQHLPNLFQTICSFFVFIGTKSE